MVLHHHRTAAAPTSRRPRRPDRRCHVRYRRVLGLLRRDLPCRGPQRLRDLRRDLAERHQVGRLHHGRTRARHAHDYPGEPAHYMGHERWQPDRVAARLETRTSARTHRRRWDPLRRVHPRQHGIGARHRHCRRHDAVPRHGRPLHPQRSDVGRNALQLGDRPDDEPRGDDALGREQRWPGRRVHLRSRTVRGVHPSGQPCVGSPRARQHR